MTDMYGQLYRFQGLTVKGFFILRMFPSQQGSRHPCGHVIFNCPSQSRGIPHRHVVTHRDHVSPIRGCECVLQRCHVFAVYASP